MPMIRREQSAIRPGCNRQHIGRGAFRLGTSGSANAKCCRRRRLASQKRTRVAAGLLGSVSGRHWPQALTDLASPCSAAPPFPFEKTGPANPIQPTDNLATEMQSWSLKVLKVVGVLERTFRIVCPPRLEAAVQTVRRAILRRACSARGRRKLQDRASHLRCFTYAGLRS